MNHPRARLDDRRKTIINRSLKIGYSVGELKTAIDGCARTPHNMGQNDRGQVYDGLHVILRDADQIDRFIRNSTLVIPNRQQPTPVHDVNDISWMHDSALEAF